MHSVPGSGSTFWFEVPLEPGCTQSGTVTDTGRLPLPFMNLTGLRALVVDDNGNNREILQQHLNDWNVVAATAVDGAAALQMLQPAESARFDLILLDDRMPGLSGTETAQRIRQDARHATAKLVLITSQDASDTGGTAMLFAAVLPKPVRRSQLFAALCQAMSLESAPPNAASNVPAALPAAPRGPRILLVEDNPVNREVAVGMLESLGCRSEVANNGRLAIEAMSDTVYDAILMDCQMPVMDGLTATAEIRRRERGAGAVRVPVIALTANAMEGDSERCLAAGMDDFLSKPFTQQQLTALLKRWLAPRLLSPPDRHEQARPPLIDVGVLRNITALARPALLNSLIDLYLQHSPTLLAAVETAAAARQAQSLSEAVHTLKSSTANLGGTRLAMVAKECEALVREGGIAEAGPLVSRIRKEHQDFCGALLRERSATAA